MTFNEILEIMIEREVSDLFIRVGSYLKGRVYSEVVTLKDHLFSGVDMEKLVFEMAGKAGKDILLERKSYEFATTYEGRWRFRIGIFYQRNSPAMVIRKINLEIASFTDLNIPEKVLTKLCHERRGLVLLTGVTGSGKSTAIASMIEYINQNFRRHILTIEEPIEFTFTDKKSIINQREIGKDVYSYADALKQFTIHSPDVIFIGNIRDPQTCHAALTAAETGVLVFSTVHTVDATSTVERIVNFYPPEHHLFVFNQLSTLLKGAVSLRLIPRIDAEGLIPAYEAMTQSPTISRLIRENKIWEMPKYLSSGEIYGMKTFNQSLFELVEAKKISPENALENSDKKDELLMQLRHKEYI